MSYVFRYQKEGQEPTAIPGLMDVRFIGADFALCIFADQSSAGVSLKDVTQFTIQPISDVEEAAIIAPEPKIIMPA